MKLQLLRLGVVVILGSLIAILGGTSYVLLHSSEIKSFTQIFDSLSDLTARTIHTNLQGKLYMLLAVATGFSVGLSGTYVSVIGTPPNITIPGFEGVAFPMMRITKVTNIGFMPIIHRDKRKEWEAYAEKNIDELELPDSYKNRSKGHWTVYDGIYEINSLGKKIYDSGNESDSQYANLLTPIWEVAPLEPFAEDIMFNMHSQQNRKEEIDLMIADESSVLSDLLETRGNPSSIVFAPVVLTSTQKLIGIFYATIPWDLILENIFPSYLPGVHFVLSTSTKSYTFLIKNGKAISLGIGDRHDPRFTNYKKDISTIFSDLPTTLATDYTMTIYPTESLYREHVTSIPGIVCGSVIALVVFTSLVILFYDFAIRKREEKLMKDLIFSDFKSKISDLVKGELETKSSFIRYVSHEVRNPLNIVALGLDHLRLQIKEDNKDAMGVISELASATKQAVVIMDNLLTFEKLTSNILELRKAKVPVICLLEENIGLMQIQAKHKAVELRLDLDDSLKHSLTMIAIDKLKVNQVIQNLLSNAIRFSPPGKEVVIRASLVNNTSETKIHHRLFEPSRRTEGPKKNLKLEVIDQGPGISAENQKRLFREVVEFTPGEFHDGKGSGLSLWISHQIVGRHEGALFVDSGGLGMGTTFTMELPLLNEEYHQKQLVETSRLADERTVKADYTEHGSTSLLKRVSLQVNFKGRNPSSSRAGSSKKLGTGMAYGVCEGAVICERESHSVGDPQEQVHNQEVNVLISDDRNGHSADAEVSEPSELFKHSCREQSLVMKPDFKILVVDDVAMNRKMLSRQLEQRWNNISCAEDGKVAAEMVREAAISGEPYDIVLMDFEMPVMNGPDAAKIMRIEGYTGLIIGVTGNGLPVDIELFLKRGADKVLLKPVNFSMLEENILSLQTRQEYDRTHPFQNCRVLL